MFNKILFGVSTIATVTVCRWNPPRMNIRLVPLIVSRFSGLLRQMHNTGWLVNGYSVQQRKESESWRKKSERGIEAWRAASLYHPILAHYTMYGGAFPLLLHGNYFPAQR